MSDTTASISTFAEGSTLAVSVISLRVLKKLGRLWLFFYFKYKKLTISKSIAVDNNNQCGSVVVVYPYYFCFFWDVYCVGVKPTPIYIRAIGLMEVSKSRTMFLCDKWMTNEYKMIENILIIFL